MNDDALEKSFRVLREAWFSDRLRSYSHEREWESEERAELRRSQNIELKKMYDAQTDGIIAGEQFEIAPRCAADLYPTKTNH